VECQGKSGSSRSEKVTSQEQPQDGCVRREEAYHNSNSEN